MSANLTVYVFLWKSPNFSRLFIFPHTVKVRVNIITLLFLIQCKGISLYYHWQYARFGGLRQPMSINDASQCPTTRIVDVQQRYTPISTNDVSPYPSTMFANIHQGYKLVSYENSAQCPPKFLARILLALPPVITSLSGSSSLRSVARVLVEDDGTEISLMNNGRKTNLQTSDDTGIRLLSTAKNSQRCTTLHKKLKHRKTGSHRHSEGKNCINCQSRLKRRMFLAH